TLIIFIGLKVSLLAAIVEHAGLSQAVLILIGSEAASRASMLVLWYALPSARPGGLSDNVGAPKWETLLCAVAIGFGILIITILPASGYLGLFYGLALTSALLFGFAKLCIAKI